VAPPLAKAIDRAMDSHCRFSSAVSFLLLLLFVRPVYAQAGFPEPPHRNWDVGVWVAGATGEENLNSLSEAQILTAEIS
jgi:hypothetical protein